MLILQTMFRPIDLRRPVSYHRAGFAGVRRVLRATLPAFILTCNSPVILANVLDLVRSAPQGSWLQVNQNAVSSVWTPLALRTPDFIGGNSIDQIINAHSSFAWDSSRQSLIIYGGGHAAYPGNDVYTWNGNNLLWERSSLPSKVVPTSINGYIIGFPADGAMNAPLSSHTYDNTVYLKASDRYLTFGGAAWNSGNAYIKDNGNGTISLTGPYLFDPAKADGNKVGGTTGSGVNPLTLGSQAWSNRDTFTSSVSPTAKPRAFIDTVSDTTVVNGKDVVYVTGISGGTVRPLYRYTINNLQNPSEDTWEIVGSNENPTSAGQSAGALAPNLNMFVLTGDHTQPFLAWNLESVGASNSDVVIVPTDLTDGLAPTSWVNYGLVFDPVRNYFVAWGGKGDVWKLKPPPGTFSSSGWTVSLLDVNEGAIPGPLNTIGVLGKWQYAPDLDAFVALQGKNTGDVWVYKPEGWLDPVAQVPEPETVALMLLGLAVVIARVRSRNSRQAARSQA